MQICDLFLLLHIESALVNAVGHDGLAQLTAGQVVQNAALLAGVNDFAVVQRLILFGQLCFFGQLCEDVQNLIINGSGTVIEIKAFTHGDAVSFHALCAGFSGHGGNEIYALCILQFLIGCQGIHVFPSNHADVLLNIYQYRI